MPTPDGKYAIEGDFQSEPPKCLNKTEPLSINDILRKHNGDRLFVPPLHLTLQHLALLECHFAGKEIGLHGYKQSQFPESLRVTARQLPGSFQAKTSIIRDLLAHFNLRCCNTELSFSFGQRVVASIKTDGLFSPASSPNLPRLAYLDLEATKLRRNNSVPIPKSRQPNRPAIRLQLKRRQRLQPAKNFGDPYIVAVLIALAQKQHYQDQAVSTDANRKV